MYQKDYILRMIEMIADLIAKLLGLIKKGEYQKASETLDHAYYNFLKQDAADLRGIPKEDLTNKLLKEHNYKNGHLEILSMLFYAQAELFYAQKNHAESLEYNRHEYFLRLHSF